MPQNRIPNQLLASLSSGDFERLRPNLQSADLIYDTVLVESGNPVERVYFPHSGIISLVVRLKTGLTIEAAMIGRDGGFGAEYAFDGRPSSCTAIVQMEGKASSIDVASLRIAAAHSVTLRAALGGYEYLVHAQALQAAACNASHTVEARLSRRLLRARDLSGSDRLTFSQEFLSQMLGTHRNTVSIVAHSLQRAGLIRYSRGTIVILDVEGLAKNSCECYETLRALSAGASRNSQIEHV